MQRSPILITSRPAVVAAAEPIDPSPLAAGIDAHGPFGVVAGVRPGSPAALAGLRAGDVLLAIDGVAPRDLIDVRYQTHVRETVRVDLHRGGVIETLRLRLAGEADAGIKFEQPTFDGLRQCNNNCEFCFIRGLPKGLRRTLYIRDDDYRYSFLFGTFLTLTNLAEEDWNRIGYQRLSPLRVSAHATDPGVRARLLAHPDAPPILPQLERLGRAGVVVHAQIVLCPGINDGSVLERTVFDLAALHDVVESLAVVPVGISDHLRVREVRAVQPDKARETVRQLTGWHRRFRRELGRGFVYPSDELFLMAGRRVPGAGFYDGFPQLQNGVGLTRLMLVDWRRQRRHLPTTLSAPRRVSWLCGRAARYALEEMARDANRVAGLDVDVRVVENSLFGAAIGVSGLMSGRDAAAALDGSKLDLAVLPRAAFGHEGERTLDDWTVGDIEARSGVPIRLAKTAHDLIAATIG